MVTGQSLWARRSCFSCATSFLSRVTSFWWRHKTNTSHFQPVLPFSAVKWTNLLSWLNRGGTGKRGLTVREALMLARSSAFFSKELTHSFLFCLQREAAARFLSRKRCLLSSGSISVARRRRPPVGWAGDTLGIKKGIIVRNFRLNTYVEFCAQVRRLCFRMMINPTAVT